MQPTNTGPARTAASQTTDPGQAEPADTASADLEAIPLAEQTSMPTLEQAAPADEGLSGAVSAGNTGTPQTAAKASGVKSANPQAVSATRQISPTTVITVPKTQSNGILTNLLHY